MRKTPLLTAPPAIVEEMHRLWQEGSDLLFWRPGASSKILRFWKLRGDQEPLRLIAEKQTPFMAGGKGGWIFYQVAEQGRAFEGVILEESPEHLTLAVPSVVFAVWYRKSPRVACPASASVVFVPARSRHLLPGYPLDISLGGARLMVVFPASVRKGDLIGPVSFSLPLTVYPGGIVSFTVAEATVVWSKDKKGGGLQIGISFRTEAEEAAKIAAYVQAMNAAKTAEGALAKERRRHENGWPRSPLPICFSCCPAAVG